MVGEPATPRSRTYSWADPAPLAPALATLSGLEFLSAIGAGTLPPSPIVSSMNIAPVEVAAGRVVFELVPAEWHYNPLGTVHGGVLATLADTVLGCAVHSALPLGSGYTTLDISVSYVRPVTVATGRVRAVGTVVSLGRRAATSRCELTDPAGKVVAHGSSTCLVFPLPPSTEA